MQDQMAYNRYLEDEENRKTLRESRVYYKQLIADLKESRAHTVKMISTVQEKIRSGNPGYETMLERLNADVAKCDAEIAEWRELLGEINERLVQLGGDEPFPAGPAALLPGNNSVACGSGGPPVEGAIPALTYTGADGQKHIGLCRSPAGEETPAYRIVGEGWIAPV